MAALGAAILGTGGMSAQLTQTLTFNYTGALQTYTVPSCVTAMTVAAYGAEGVSVGSSNFAPGKGGLAAGVIQVMPGQVLNIYVGGQSGYNGGGLGQIGGNGGGATDIRIGGITLADRVMVAGGGGGAGGDSWQCNSGGGHGGGGVAVGANFVGGGGGAGYTSGTGCGTDGGNTGGTGGVGYHGGGGGGGGFTSGGGGANANGGGGVAGTGSLGIGGNSPIASGCSGQGSGGGGGGYYGGGGAAGTNCGAGRGGGGSSWTGTLTSPAFAPGVRSGNGQLIIVIPSPSVSAVANNTFICLGGSSTLTASGALSYTWTGASGAIGNNSVITVSPGTSSTYTLTGTNIANCTYSAVATVAVNTLTMSVTPATGTAVCQGASANLSAAGAGNYNWSNGLPFQSIAVNPSVTTVYTVTGTDANNCVISNTVQVTVNMNPTVTASASKTLVCKNEPVTLTAGGASTYSWSGGLGTNAVVSITPAINTLYTFTATGTDANGCVNKGAVSIDVKLCTGIDEESADLSSISVFPNPSNGSFSIQSDMNIKLNVVNELGQVIKTVQLNGTTKKVDVSGLSEGIYFIKGESNGKAINHKVVVTK